MIRGAPEIALSAFEAVRRDPSRPDLWVLLDEGRLADWRLLALHAVEPPGAGWLRVGSLQGAPTVADVLRALDAAVPPAP